MEQGLYTKLHDLTIEGSGLDCDRCGKCCIDTSMQLSLDDILRLEKLGYAKKEFVRVKDGFYTLRNQDGACFFFDVEQRSCRAYAGRPSGCRYYPIIYSLDERRPITDSKECHRASTVTEHELKASAPKLATLIKKILRDSPKRE